VGVVHVGLDEIEITLDHLQGGVAEETLEGVDVAAVAEEVDGKGVAVSGLVSFVGLLVGGVLSAGLVEGTDDSEGLLLPGAIKGVEVIEQFLI